MTLLRFRDRVPPALVTAIEEFEKEFSYPLGDALRFRISHGEDYPRFFRAMGPADLLAVESEGIIRGVITRVSRRVMVSTGVDPDVEITGHYLCDLKVRAEARGSLVLARMFREVKQSIEATESTACYCVVMDGTGRLPTDYTGRLGVPVFQAVGKIKVLRLMTGEDFVAEGAVTGREQYAAIATALACHGVRPVRGDGSSRSSIGSKHITTRNGGACGILEDTRCGKKLILESGGELLSAHLSDLRFATAHDGGELIRTALKLAAENGFPALFLAIPERIFPSLAPTLAGLQFTEAPATVFAHGFPEGAEWWIDTAEI